MEPENLIALLGVDYKQDGRLWKIVCPFHHDTHPSLVVYPQDRGYHCYSCGANGTWAHLYKEIKGCEWKEAYDAVGMSSYDSPIPKKKHIEFDFVDEPEHSDIIRQRYAACQPLPQVAQDFLKSKGVLEVATELGWKWDTTQFKQSGKGAIVIPYREGDEIVYARLRPLKRSGDGFEKPVSLKGIHSRPYVLTRPNQPLYICEGCTDALSLYASGCSVVAVPGVSQVRCINTAVLYASLTSAPYIVACGDNDGPGQTMNEHIQKAAKALVSVPVQVLSPDSLGGLNDINDAYVAGVLKLPKTDPVAEIFPNARPLEGWDAVYANCVFSEPEECWKEIFSEAANCPDSDQEFVSSICVDDIEEMRAAWNAAPPALQSRYVILKECCKLAVAKDYERRHPKFEQTTLLPHRIVP